MPVTFGPTVTHWPVAEMFNVENGPPAIVAFAAWSAVTLKASLAPPFA